MHATRKCRSIPKKTTTTLGLGHFYSRAADNNNNNNRMVSGNSNNLHHNNHNNGHWMRKTTTTTITTTTTLVTFYLVLVVVIVVVGPSTGFRHSQLARYHRNANGAETFNVTADLLRESNTSTWYSIDQYLNNTANVNELLAHPLDGEHCFFTSNCSLDPEHATKRLINIWLRCNRLNGVSDLSHRLDALYHLLEERTKFETHHLCSLQGQTSSIRLRLDFLLSEAKLDDILSVLKRVWLASPTNADDGAVAATVRSVPIVIEHLTLARMGLDSRVAREFLLPLIGPGLRVLNLTGNQLSDFDFGGVQQHLLSQLTTIDLSSNRLTSFDVSRLERLHTLDVHNNSMVSLAREQLPQSLVHSQETFVNQQIPFFRYELNFADNPWDCGARPETHWFIYNFIAPLVARQENIFSRGRPRFWKSNEPECESPKQVRWFPFSVFVSVRSAAICERCQCYMQPKYALAHYRYMVVNCSGVGVGEVPLQLPKNVRTVDLSNNRIPNLLPIAKADEALPAQWLDVMNLDLRNNSIESIEGIERLRATKIELAGNLLTEVPLYLVEMLIAQKHIDKMSLGNNPYLCECETIKLKQWVSDHYSDSILLDPQHIRCGDLRPELEADASVVARIAIDRGHRFYRQEVTSLETVHLCPDMFWWQPYHLYFNVLLAMLIVLLVGKVVYDYFWQKRTGKLPKFFKLNH